MIKKKIKKTSSYKWLKLSFIKEDQGTWSFFWRLPKKHIPLAVTRNRFKRWGRLFFKELEKESLVKKKVEDFGQDELKEKKGISGKYFIFALKQEKNFYKELKRRDFDDVFKKTFERLFYKDQTKKSFQEKEKA